MRLMYIRWRDARKSIEGSYTELELGEFQLIELEHTGWGIESEDRIVLAGERAKADSMNVDDTFRQIWAIPRSGIVEVKYLEESCASSSEIQTSQG